VSATLGLYRAVTRLLEPLAPHLLNARARQGKEDAARVGERLGQPSLPRPPGELIWLHGVSVGESLSLLPLVERLRRDRPDLTPLVTSGTRTSAALLARRLPPGALHQYAPVDGPRAVAAFLDHWRPAVGVLVESELWPNLVLEAKARDLPLALISARITPKTARGWSRAPGAARRLLEAFRLILAQEPASGARLESLGGRVDGLANLKLAGEAPPHDAAAFTALSAAIGDRPVVVAASTHPGEETAIARALARLARPVCLILVPRHPERALDISSELARDGRRPALRSRGQTLDARTDVYVADTLGEMGLFLRLADVVVMGGGFGPALGLAPVGGHNPLEPARLARPTLTGPDLSNWEGVAALLVEAGGLQVVATPDALTPAVARLLDDPDAARALGEAARRAAAEAGSVVDDVFAALTPLLPPASARSGGT